MKKLILALSILTISLTSCKKNSPEPTQTTQVAEKTYELKWVAGPQDNSGGDYYIIVNGVSKPSKTTVKKGDVVKFKVLVSDYYNSTGLVHGYSDVTLYLDGTIVWVQKGTSDFEFEFTV